MALSDILTVPFLISLGITLSLIGIVGFLFAQRLQQQNHKITSMFGLVTSVAEEMNFIRGRLQMMSYQGSIPVNETNHQTGGTEYVEKFGDLEEENLIPVSDGETQDNDSESNNDLDSDDDQDDDEDDDQDDESECDDPEVIELTDNSSGGIKIINFAEMLKLGEEQKEINDDSEDLGELDELDELDEIEELDDDSVDSQENNLENLEIKTFNKSELEFTKTIDISISNLEKSEDKSTFDYKKMSLNKLKEIAVAKGLINENSKATKNVILKLLDSEQ